MPAKVLRRTSQEGTYCHIYNKGVGKENIFKDGSDYDVFLGYLSEYLSVLGNPEDKKKEFVIKGRTFKGKPHQPKNYFDKVELVAYSLMPDHFHLLLFQKSQGSIESFLRSLCTRYSIYFNKKYVRKGMLFEGPYKSVNISGISEIALLSGYIHNDHNFSSSLPEYLKARETAWVKPSAVLSYFESRDNTIYKGDGGYEGFVKGFELSDDQKKILSNLIIEAQDEPRDNAPAPATKAPREEVKVATFSKKTYLAPWQRAPEIIGIFVVFILLVGVGVSNINASSSEKTLGTSTSSSPLSTPEVVSSPTPVSEVKTDIAPTIVIVRIEDGSKSVNIRLLPNASSEKVGTANNGDTFELVANESGWYHIKLSDGSTGYISAKYAQIKE